MNWKIRAAIQNAISRLPSDASYAAYYWVQRRIGGLRHIDPTKRLTAGVETWRHIQRQDRSPIGKTFLEVGTGRVPLVPLSYWLMGAEHTITIDVNPYLKEELIVKHLRCIVDNKEDIVDIFGSLIDEKRFQKLLSFAARSSSSSAEFLELCRVTYVASGDAADTNLPDESIDFHTSYTVLEHIPLDILIKIFEEGDRVVKPSGLFVHRIDYSDHFSHSDNSISAINFLQFSDSEWERYAGNRYMYMNRLRHDDFLDLYEKVGHRILDSDVEIDRRSAELLRTGDLSLNEKFSSKTKEILAIRGAWMVTAQKA